jgi:hypothetical protein
MMAKPDPIFLDTSIAIARVVHGPGIKEKIKARLQDHGAAITSLVVKQEFKRRLLKEAQYLLNQLNDKGSFARVLRHVSDVLPPQQGRKRNICLQTLETVFEGADDEELTERAKIYMRQLLRRGLSDLEGSVDHVMWESGCACSSYPVEEKVPYKRYDFGPEKCSQVAGRCGIVAFFQNHANEARAILDWLRRLSTDVKSDELKRAEAFIEKALDNATSICSWDPCLKLGDLVIALESVGIGSFYTMNGKESQYLCGPLNQTLIVRPKNPAHEDIVCLTSESEWPTF